MKEKYRKMFTEKKRAPLFLNEIKKMEKSVLADKYREENSKNIADRSFEHI